MKFPFSRNHKEESCKEETPYTQEQLDQLAQTLLSLNDVPMNTKPLTGGLDTSAITCGCSCHTVYGPGSGPSPTKDSCDHCQLLG
jgi:hypothetical protein